MTKKRAATCLILHKKSCMRPEVRVAVRRVGQSTPLDVCIPWRGKDLRKFVRQAIEGGRPADRRRWRGRHFERGGQRDAAQGQGA